MLFFFTTSFTLKQSGDGADEYRLKVAFIYNFTKFIEWNEYMYGEEFVIGVIGSSPIYEPLLEIAQTKTINGKKIRVTKFDIPEEIHACHILFISKETSVPLKDILTKTNVKGMLIIGEQSQYAAQGVCINFVVIDDKLKFEANEKAINAVGLTASSQLLKLAILID